MLGRIAANWVYGTGPAAILLLLLAPLLLGGQPEAVILAFLALPAYMLHQVEEHDADRFRHTIAALLGPTRAGLRPADIAFINLGLVWLPLTLVVWLAARVDGGWAAVAGWFMLVNALTHIGAGLARRRYNPGLATAIVLFVPLGVWIVTAAGAAWGEQLTGAAAVLALHALIVLRALAPRRQFSGKT